MEKNIQIKNYREKYKQKYEMNVFNSPKFPKLNNFNLTLIYLYGINIIDKINDHLLTITKYYELIINNNFNVSFEFTLYRLETEETIYWIRKYIDSMIIISYILIFFEKNKKEPDIIEIDSIGKYLATTKKEYKMFDDFEWLFEKVNEISNCYKHSINNMELNIIGQYEPCVSAFSTKQKKLYNISLKELIQEFEKFVIESKIKFNSFF